MTEKQDSKSFAELTVYFKSGTFKKIGLTDFEYKAVKEDLELNNESLFIDFENGESPFINLQETIYISLLKQVV